MNGILLLPLNVVRISHFLLPFNALPISYLLLPINVMPLSHLLLPFNVLPISHLLLPLNVLSISHLLLLLIDVLPINHPNLLLLLHLLYPKTKTMMIKEKTKKKNANAPSDENNTNQEKGSVLHDEDKTQKKKNSMTEECKWEDKEKPMRKKECTLEAKVLVDLDHGSTPFDIFQTVTGINELLKITVTETNRYATQKGRNFETTEDEMKTFLGINFIMGISKLPSLEDYWSTGKCIRNEKIQNVMTRTRFLSILQNLHFPITTMIIKLINRTKSVLLSNM